MNDSSTNTTMNTPPKPDYGEPWHYDDKNDDLRTRIGGVIAQQLNEPYSGRIIQCVNAMAGRPDPAAAMARLKQLEWVPVTERLPELDDANEFEDVEWSDGKDIWQGSYKCAHTRSATHWRRVVLP